MKLIATIREELLHKTSFLYLSGDCKLAGCTFKEGKVSRIDEETMKVLFDLLLGENSVKLDRKEEYDVILDLDTGYKHYLLNGKEDFEEFYLENGIEATLYKSATDKGFWQSAREFMVATNKIMFSGMIGLIVTLTLLNTVRGVRFNDKNIIFLYNPIENSGIVFGEDGTFSCGNGVTVEDLKRDIASSDRLNMSEKQFLLNTELLEDVVPYYVGTDYEIISRIYHHNIGIVPFTEREKVVKSDIVGFWAHDNSLHVRDYEFYEEGAFNSEYVRVCAGHEDAHLLETNFDLSFIDESVAEIIAHEYFNDSASSLESYSYSNQVRYTKVLMEIIGPEVVWERMFRYESKILEETILPYLDREDYDLFFEILKKDRRVITEADFANIKTLLAKIYEAKFGEPMSSNPMIHAILGGTEYNRVYFRKSLAEVSPSYYTTFEEYSIEEADRRGIIKNFVLHEEVGSLEEWESAIGDHIIDKTFSLRSAVSPNYLLSGSSVEYIDGKFVGNVSIDFGDTFIAMDAEDAIKSGYVEAVYFIDVKVSKEFFLENRDTMYLWCQLQTDGDGNSLYYYSRLDDKIYSWTSQKIFVDEIVKKGNDHIIRPGYYRG